VRIIDLSHEVYSGMPQRFPGPIPSIFDHSIRSSAHYTAVDDSSVLQHHLGTHMDAPRHYNPKKGAAVHQVPLERLITPAVVINLTHLKPLSEVGIKDLEEALGKAGEAVRPNDGVLLYVGMGPKYHTWTSGDWRESEYGRAPYLGEDAVRWLLSKHISILAIDALAPDWAEDRRPVHEILLRDNGIPIIENLCNLDKLERSRVLFVALPPKIVGAAGYPVRAVAIEE
jgi:arylformamidase